MADENSSIPAGPARAAACYARLRKYRPGAAPKKEEVIEILKQMDLDCDDCLMEAVEAVMKEVEERPDMSAEGTMFPSPTVARPELIDELPESLQPVSEPANPSIVNTEWPELEEVELPKHLQPSHERSNVEELDELLKKP